MIRPPSAARTSAPCFPAAPVVSDEDDAANHRPASGSRRACVQPPHLHPRHQALGRNPGFIGLRANPPSRRTFHNLDPACVANCRDVQMDVHFAVCSHWTLRLSRSGGILGTFTSCAARGERRGAYEPGCIAAGLLARGEGAGYGATINVRARIASSRNAPERFLRCLTRMFPTAAAVQLAIVLTVATDGDAPNTIA